MNNGRKFPEAGKDLNPNTLCICGHTHIGYVGDLGEDEDEQGDDRLEACSECDCESFKEKPNENQMKQMMVAVNKIANEMLNPPASQTKGTSYWYTNGRVGNKAAQYTKAKTHYNGRFGFWSWIATKYKNGTTKRTCFAMSGSKAKAEARAEKLLNQLEEQK